MAKKITRKKPSTRRKKTGQPTGSIEEGTYHISKQILPIISAVTDAISGGQEWYMELPHIKLMMEIPALSNLKDVIVSAGDLGKIVARTTQVFCETVYGVNLARNSIVHQQNLAGRGLSLLANSQSSHQTKSLYEAAVLAHNESLNLPALSEKIAGAQEQIGAIEQQGKDAREIMEGWRSEALDKAMGLIDRLTQTLKELKGNAKRGAEVQLNRATLATKAMKDQQLPIIYANSDYQIKSKLDWQINSTTRHEISSIAEYSIYASAIVPIAVGGAATLAGAGAIIGSIASWLLSSFFLQGLAGFPMSMLGALQHTVTSIVLKTLGSSGANAYRFLAASVIKAGRNLMPVIFAPTAMLNASWTFLMPYAVPIIGAAVIIISAMRNKIALADMLYIFGNIQDSDAYNLAQIHMYDTNHIEILGEFKETANTMYDESKRAMSSIIGVGLDKKKKYTVAYNLTNPNNPQRITGDGAIVTALGAEKVAKLMTGNFSLFE